MPFRFTNVGGIGAANQKLLDPVAPVDGPSDILNFVRGDRSKEFNSLAQENPLRRRNSILGDIIHSKPVYVGAPNDTRKETSYAEFAQLNSGRAPRVYVGANDGMLHVFDAADEVVLVDLPPDELLQRLKEGKVYLPHQAERAIQNFFRKGNLIALRELALRRTADRVDEQMLEYRRDRSVSTLWQTRESLLACIGPGDGGDRIVRNAARIAAKLDVPWHGIYI